MGRGQWVSVSFHFSKSGFGRFGSSWSFSVLPFHGSSDCLVLGQSVCCRGSSKGVSRGSSSCGCFLVIMSCKYDRGYFVPHTRLFYRHGFIRPIKKFVLIAVMSLVALAAGFVWFSRNRVEVNAHADQGAMTRHAAR